MPKLSELERRLCRIAVRQLGDEVDPDVVEAATPWAILVGEYNPYNPGDCALWPHPRNSAGHRLWKMTGLELSDYLCTFMRVNLVDEERWSKEAARDGAENLCTIAAQRGIPLVLLGAKVSEAFACEIDYFNWTHDGLVSYLRLPHPSGRSPMYNSLEARERCGVELRRATDYGRWPPNIQVPWDMPCPVCKLAAGLHPAHPAEVTLRVMCVGGGIQSGGQSVPYRVVRPWGTAARTAPGKSLPGTGNTGLVLR